MGNEQKYITEIEIDGYEEHHIKQYSINMKKWKRIRKLKMPNYVCHGASAHTVSNRQIYSFVENESPKKKHTHWTSSSVHSFICFFETIKY